MSRQRRIIISLLSILFITGCISLLKKNSVNNKGAPGISFYENLQYARATSLLQGGKFTEALKEYDDLLQKYPSSKHYQDSLLGSGRALEALGYYDEAIERYSQAINTVGGSGFVSAEALIHLSFCYEILGNDKMVIATLRDGLSRKQLLPISVWQAEIPARLAAAYSRLGDADLAEKYFNVAEEGLLNLKRNHDKQLQEDWLGKTLYNMGYMSEGEINNENFIGSVRKLDRLQYYLLQAIDTNDVNWAPKAKQNLVGLYNRLWDIFIMVPMPELSDSFQAQQEQVNTQNAWGQEILINIESLRNKRLPTSMQSPLALQMFVYIEELEEKIKNTLTKNIIGNPLTIEALKGQSLKRRGKVIDPEGMLENITKKKPTQIKEVTPPTEVEDDKLQKDDPNL